MGNSEVGHVNLGAGRIVYQDFTRISKAISDRSFFSNTILCEIRQRKFRSGMSFGYHSLTTRNTVTLTITVLASLAKIVFCYAMAGIFFWSTQKRNFWAMRGVFHRGWLASAFSTKEPELY